MAERRGGRSAQREDARGFPTPAEIDELTPKALLRRLGLRAHRGLSQSFLTDRYAVQDIVDAAGIGPEDEVMEIGPGLGILTRALVARASRVVAIEFDRDLAPLLPRLVSRSERLEVIQEDALKIDLPALFVGPYKVAANLPYHITSPLLRMLLTATRKPEVIVVMVQKEVAQRIAAKPGDTSLLSIMAQLYSRVSLVREVPAGAFFPPPEVDSAVLKLEVYKDLPVDVDAPEKLLSLVAAGFSRRRKQLHNSLSESIWFPPGGEVQVLEAAGLDPSRRAQTLTLQEWTSLYHAYENARSGWQERGRQ